MKRTFIPYQKNHHGFCRSWIDFNSGVIFFNFFQIPVSEHCGSFPGSCALVVITLGKAPLWDSELFPENKPSKAECYIFKLLNWLYFYSGTRVFLQEGVGVGHIQTVCTIRTKFKSLEDNGRLLRETWDRSHLDNLFSLILYSWLLTSWEPTPQSILNGWPHLKLGLKKNDLVGHWLRTSLTRISFANTVLLVFGRSGPCMGQANNLFRCWILSF